MALPRLQLFEFNDLSATPAYQGSYEFAGVDTHYFMSAAVKPGPAASTSAASPSGSHKPS